MAKSLVSNLILASLDQIWSPKNFLCGFYLYYMLEIVASYHFLQFQEKLKNQTWENGKKSSFRSDFGPNLGPKFFFMGFTSTRYYILLQAITVWLLQAITAISRRTNEPNLRKCKKPSFRNNFGPNLVLKNFFSWVIPLIDVRNSCKLSFYAISRKTKPEKMVKTILAHLAQIWAAKKNFFPQKSGSISYWTLWSAIIMYNIRKN